jgi:drug/metabolite transporter (DMT)-like permease
MSIDAPAALLESPKAGSSQNALLLAALGFFIGGIGNVAWSLYSGSLAAALMLRFLAGIFVVGSYRIIRRPSHPNLNKVGNGRVHLSISSAFDAGSVVLLAAAAQSVDTLTFTLIGLAGSGLLGLIAHRLPLAKASRAQIFVATGALTFSALAVVSGERNSAFSLIGVLFAVLSAGFGVVSYITGSFASTHYHPSTVVFRMCLWGCLWSTLLILTGADFNITPSTIAAAVFIAVLPGGLSKFMLYWSLARVSPYLVSACKATMLLSAGLGGWLLLGEKPTLLQSFFTILAITCVVFLSSSKNQTKV